MHVQFIHNAVVFTHIVAWYTHTEREREGERGREREGEREGGRERERERESTHTECARTHTFLTCTHHALLLLVQQCKFQTHHELGYHFCCTQTSPTVKKLTPTCEIDFNHQFCYTQLMPADTHFFTT